MKVVAEGDYLLTASESPALYTLTEGIFVWVVDLSPLQAGDTVLLRVRTRVRDSGTGATERILLRASYTGAQTDPANVSLGPFCSDQLVAKLSASQSAGTYRTIPWKLLRVDAR